MIKKSLGYIATCGLLAAAFSPQISGASETKTLAPPSIINDETIASALGANGKFFIVTADEAKLLHAPDADSKVRMTFQKNSCLMSLGNGRDQNGYARVLAMGGGKTNATGFVERKKLAIASEAMDNIRCVAIKAP